MSAYTFALCGCPNCGKTTLFNLLTGQQQHTGNWPGVTVARVEGSVQERFLPPDDNGPLHLIDLPGAVSLSAYSPEEKVTLQYLQNEKPDLILCIVNACAPAQGLYMALELITLRIPLLLVFNMSDALRAAGGSLNIQGIAQYLKLPAVEISARSGYQVPQLIEKALSMMRQPVIPHEIIPFDADISYIGRHAQLAIERYAVIDRLTDAYYSEGASRRVQDTQRIDRWALQPVVAYPLLLFVMTAVFFCTFDAPGQALSAVFSALMQQAIERVEMLLTHAQCHPLMQSLLLDGVLRGVTTVLTFLPTLLLLFTLTALLEDSGYMARAAFLLDAPLRRVGLSGRSFFPLATGLGCSVPAILATRALPGRRDRKLTALLIPYLPCSAKMPVYLFLTAAFFPHHSGLIVLGLYLLGAAFLMLVSFLLRRKLHAAASPLIMELPAYRLPTLRGILRVMRDKTRDFLTRAFTVVFFTSIVIWALQTFTPAFSIAQETENSLLFGIGQWLCPLFAPLGFASPLTIAALMAGLMAKENILTVLMMTSSVHSLFSAPSSLSFLTFTALYAPCLASCAVLARETESRKHMLLAVLLQTALAWLAAFWIYRIFSLFS